MAFYYHRALGLYIRPVLRLGENAYRAISRHIASDPLPQVVRDVEIAIWQHINEIGTWSIRVKTEVELFVLGLQAKG